MSPRRRRALLGAAAVAALAGAAVVRAETRRWLWDLPDGALPRFATSDVLPLAKVARISRFRSGAGHDFSSPPETCRSMKHYLRPAAGAGALEVRAPFAASVVNVEDEGPPGGKQLYLRSREHPAYTARLFHVEPAPGVRLGANVEAGQVVGTLPAERPTDVAVEVRTWHGAKLVSFYDVLGDDAFAPYAARGLARADLVVTRAYRDAHPFRCDPDDPNQDFAAPHDDTADDWVDLSARRPPP